MSGNVQTMATACPSPTTMPTTLLHGSDLHISPIGIGTWAMGGPWSHGWGPQDDRASHAAIVRALDAGLNWIDTAPVYGFGHSESVIARTIAGSRTRPYVFTKCGFVWNAAGEVSIDLGRASIRRECEESLRRLGVDAIDLYQLHRVPPTTAIDEAWTAMAELQREGKVRWIGLCNVTPTQFADAARIATVTSLQPAYSLIAREAEAALLPLAARLGVGVLAYSPMQCGLLSGAMTRERIATLPEDDHRRRREEFREPLLTRALDLVERLRAIGHSHGCTAGAVAIAWALHHPAITGAIVGLRRPDQVGDIARAMTLTLDAGERHALETFPVFQPA